MAADSHAYAPAAAFTAQFGNACYQRVWSDHYQGQLAPIPFVGEGVRGRVMFYDLGMGRAYVLDLQKPGWRADYLNFTLDAILGPPEAEPAVSRPRVARRGAAPLEAVEGGPFPQRPSRKEAGQ